MAQPDIAEVGAALNAHANRWAELFSAGDFDAMVDLYEPDAWLMSHAQPAKRSRAEILDGFRVAAANGRQANIRFENESVEVTGPMATVIGKYWMDVAAVDDQPAMTVSGRSLVIYKQGADGVWRLWRDMDNQAPDITEGEG